MDDVIGAIRTLLTAGLTSGLYDKIYYGPNLVPSESQFPFVEVVPLSEELGVKGTNSMRNEFEIMIRIQDSLKNFVTANTDKSVLSHVQTIVKRMGERDSNGKPLSTTILGVLHDNLKLSDTVHINNIGTVGYNFNELKEGSWIVTAEITITAKLISLRS